MKTLRLFVARTLRRFARLVCPDERLEVRGAFLDGDAACRWLEENQEEIQRTVHRAFEKALDGR